MSKNAAPLNHTKSLDSEIEAIMSRTLYVNAFADLSDELSVPLGGGADYMDAAGATPKSFSCEAAFLSGTLEHLNNETMGQMYIRALSESGLEDSEELRSNFGHYIVMEALGHGVSWNDDHNHFDRKMPISYSQMIATPTQSSILDNTDFDLDNLDEDDHDDVTILERFNDLPTEDAPNPFYLAEATGIAKGFLVAGLKAPIESLESQKAMLASNIIKHDEAILAGFRVLGAAHAAERHINGNIYGLLASTSGIEGEAFKVNPQDLIKYRALAGDTTNPIDYPETRGTESRIISGQRLHDFIFKDVTYPEFPNAKAPNIPRDYSEIANSMQHAPKPSGPSLGM
jgi:hypothetical protein